MVTLRCSVVWGRLVDWNDVLNCSLFSINELLLNTFELCLFSDWFSLKLFFICPVDVTPFTGGARLLLLLCYFRALEKVFCSKCIYGLKSERKLLLFDVLSINNNTFLYFIITKFLYIIIIF